MKHRPRLARSPFALVATLFGLGDLTEMPGTVGTLAALVVLMIFGGVHPAALVCVIVVGTFCIDRYLRETGDVDAHDVVIDAVAGFFVSVFGLGASYGIVAFFLFRVVAICRPFPMGMLSRLRGGVGVMADDICGGIIVNVLLRAFQWFYFGGGLASLLSLVEG